MKSDVEDILREGISRLTTGAGPPPGLVERARRRNRQRRIAIRAAAATGTAVVAAVAAIAVTSSSAGTGSALHEQTISYVTSRTRHALSGVAQGKFIEQVQSAAYKSSFGFTMLNTVSGVQPNSRVLSGVHAQRDVLWTYQGLTLDQGFTAAGQPVYSSSISTVTSPTGKKVPEAYGAAYPARVSWRVPLTGGPNWPLPPLSCENASAGGGVADWQALISKALSCKLYTLGGRQQVNGVSALKLTMKPVSGEPYRQTLWVDPSTYLPLRVSTTFLPPWGNNSVRVEDFRWLPPTPANLAALHAAIRQAAIPAGFRLLPPTDLPLVGFGAPLNP